VAKCQIHTANGISISDFSILYVNNYQFFKIQLLTTNKQQFKQKKNTHLQEKLQPTMGPYPKVGWSDQRRFEQ